MVFNLNKNIIILINYIKYKNKKIYSILIKLLNYKIILNLFNLKINKLIILKIIIEICNKKSFN
jgi:hypothetical protein